MKLTTLKLKQMIRETIQEAQRPWKPKVTRKLKGAKSRLAPLPMDAAMQHLYDAQLLIGARLEEIQENNPSVDYSVDEYEYEDNIASFQEALDELAEVAKTIEVLSKI